jgi:hypothetical protein
MMPSEAPETIVERFAHGTEAPPLRRPYKASRRGVRPVGAAIQAPDGEERGI